MTGKKYRYNTKTLSYERVQHSTRDKFIQIGSVLAILAIITIYFSIDSPREKRLQRENAQLKLQFEVLNKKLDQVDLVVQNLQNRDDNIYRNIFEADPIPSSIRQAGFGGVNRYEHLEGFDHSSLVIQTNKKLDRLTKQVYIQSKSFDAVAEMAKKKEEMLASIPSIMPVSNKDLKRMSSGFGMRIHPILKIRKMHTGQDFTAKTGTEVYASGNGKVTVVKKERHGYGYHVIIDHGYGYKTLYAHLSGFKVRKGQQIKRGEVLGYVGNTGRSTGPHLHYEVIKNGKKINPVNYYYQDLSPKQYEEVIDLSNQPLQSFD